MTILAAAAGLLDIAHLGALDGAGDRLAVGHLGLANPRLHAELAQHAVNQHFQVQLAHARDNGLPGLLVRRTRKVGSSSESLRRASPILSWSAVVFGSMATEMTGSGKEMFSRITVLEASHRVSPVKEFFQPQHSADIAGIDLGDILAPVGVHAQQTTDALALLLGGVVHHGALR